MAAKTTLVVQHDYLTLKVKFQALGGNVNFTINRHGPKVSAPADIDRKDFEALYDAFEKAWKAQAFGTNMLFVEAVKALADAAETPKAMVEALAAISSMPRKPLVIVEVDNLIAKDFDFASCEVAPPKIVSVPRLTQEELQAAFDLVKNKKDWKARIDRTIDVADLARVMEAIVHFTGTVPYEVAHPTNPNKVIVRAAGYRAGGFD